MKQILQHPKTGEMELAEAPCPPAGRGQVLIQTRVWLLSAGTERMLVEFSQANRARASLFRHKRPSRGIPLTLRGHFCILVRIAEGW